MSQWIPICRASEIPEGFHKCAQLGEAGVLIFNLDGEFHAIEDNCTHLNLSMKNGERFDKEFVCPWHGAAFDITTGICLGPPGRRDLQYYPVRVENGTIFIQND